MSKSIAYAWAPITKMERQEDGSLIVHGPAASPVLDRDGQGLDPTWLAEAFPKWYEESGNIREQHDPKRAVGKAIGYAQDGDVHMIAARVVDPVAVAKCEAGVLQGFSVGVKNPQITFGDSQYPNGKVVGGSICETSLVDRPSNPTTIFDIAKADDAGELVAVEDPHVVETSDDASAATADDDESATQVPEAVKAEAQAVVAAIGELGVDLAKADNASDISDAQSAIAIIARLIQSEASGLAAGRMSETYDIGNLLDAVRALRYFIECEQSEQAEATSVTFSDGKPDMAKADTEQPAPEVSAPKVEAPADDVTKADEPTLTKAEVADLVKAAIAEATKPLTDQIAELRDRPAGADLPVLTRTDAQHTAARTVDGNSLKAQAAVLLAKADSIEDPFLAQGYRDRARDLLAKVD